MKYTQTSNFEVIAALREAITEYEAKLAKFKVKIASLKATKLPEAPGALLAPDLKENGTPFNFKVGQKPERLPIDSSIEAISESMEDGPAFGVRFNTDEGYKCFAVAPTAFEPIHTVIGLNCPAVTGKETKVRRTLQGDFAALVFNETTSRYAGNPATVSKTDNPDDVSFTAIVQDDQLRYAGRAYKYVPISEALDTAEQAVKSAFDSAQFKRAEFSHAGLTVQWGLGAAVSESYRVLKGKVDSLMAEATAVLQFDTSNTSDSAIRLQPRLVLKSGAMIPAGSGVRVLHRGDKPLELFAERAKDIAKSFSDMPSEFERLDGIEVENPEGCLRRLYAKVQRTSKRYVESAANFGTMYPSCTALDILCEGLEQLHVETSTKSLSLAQAADLCDAFARRVFDPKFRAEFDRPVDDDSEVVVAEEETA